MQAGRLLLGFTRSVPGNWTSWPPHEHTEMLEEVYVYFDMPPPAFGIQLVYTSPDTPEFVGVVRDGDAVLMPAGYHPNVAAPGHSINFIWMMAAHDARSRIGSSAWSTSSPASARRARASKRAESSRSDSPHGSLSPRRPHRAGHRARGPASARRSRVALAEAGADVACHGNRHVARRDRRARSRELGRRAARARRRPRRARDRRRAGRGDRPRARRASTSWSTTPGIIRRAPAVDASDDDWDAVLAINLSAVFRLCRAAGRRMLAHGRGKIVNIASLLSFQGGITVPAYAASKGGVAQLTKALANEWAAQAA